MVVGAGSIVSPVAEGKTVVTAVGVIIPPPLPPPAAEVLTTNVVADLVAEVVVDLIMELVVDLTEGEVTVVLLIGAAEDLIEVVVEVLDETVIVWIVDEGLTVVLAVVVGALPPVPGTHWLYHSLENLQVKPETHVVAPDQLFLSRVSKNVHTLSHAEPIHTRRIVHMPIFVLRIEAQRREAPK